MGLFFKSNPNTIESAMRIALEHDAIMDRNVIVNETKKILEETQATSGKVFKRGNMFIAAILLGATFVGALTIGDEKVRQTLLDCFKILFTAIIGILGFEANKK